jgi:hypothetical protein
MYLVESLAESGRFEPSDCRPDGVELGGGTPIKGAGDPEPNPPVMPTDTHMVKAVTAAGSH